MLTLCICNEPALEQSPRIGYVVAPTLMPGPQRAAITPHSGQCCKKQFADNFQCFNQTGLT